MTRTRTGVLPRLVVALGAVALLLGVLTPYARALPPGGAGGSTEGTSSTVSGQVAVGGTISFTLSGFPAGETVYVKVDDGISSGEDSSFQGAGVVYTAAVDANGNASGSFTLPSYVGEGTHWLRFLATSSAGSKDGGNVGYTNRSPDFVVGSTSSSTVVDGSGTTGTTTNGSAGAAGATAGAVEVPAAAAEVQLETTAASATPTATAAGSPTATAVAAAPASEDKAGFPVLGASVLGATVLVMAVVLTAVIARRRGPSAQ